jgi:hypothetical protein
MSEVRSGDGRTDSLVDGQIAAELLGLKHRQQFQLVRKLFGISPFVFKKVNSGAKTPTAFYKREQVERLKTFIEGCKDGGWESNGRRPKNGREGSDIERSE